LQKKCIYKTKLLHLFETVLKRRVLPSGGSSPYYMIFLSPSGNNVYMKHKYKRSKL